MASTNTIRNSIMGIFALVVVVLTAVEMAPMVLTEINALSLSGTGAILTVLLPLVFIIAIVLIVFDAADL